MPRVKGGGKGATKPIPIRFPADEEEFYRRQSRDHGMTLSAYLRKMVVQGVVAENIQDVEARLQALIGTIPTSMPVASDSTPDDIALSVFTCEALLTSIVESQETQTLYRAQEAARAKLKKRKGA